MSSETTVAEAGPGPASWRLKLGMALFLSGILVTFLIPLAVALGMPAARVAALTATIFVGKKVLLVIVIAIVGKAGFQQLKRIVFGYFGRFAPDLEVGPTRYRIGLVMFCLPLISGWLEPYIDTFWPNLRPDLWQIQLSMDLMFVASLFVLGGNFWGKVRALFVRTAVVTDPTNNGAVKA